MEKYGTVPPRFSVQWWEHYLYYYKFHIAVVLFFIFMFGSIIYSNVTRKHYDLHISYIGFGELEETHKQKLSAYLEPVIDEITDNDIKEIEYVFYPVQNVMQDDMVSDAEYAYQMKFVAELQGGDCDIYIMSETNTEELAGFGENFINAKELAGDAFPAEKIKCDSEGYPFAVSLSGNEKLSDFGINHEKLYICVRKLYETNAEDEDRINMHKNSINAAKQLIGV